MQITLDLSEELVSRLNSIEDQLPRVIELGLRELNASSQDGFNGIAEVLEFLARIKKLYNLAILTGIKI